MGAYFLLAVLLVLSCCVSSLLSLELAPYSLPGRLYPSKYVTVSGAGTGGIFAQIMHIAHSKYIKGCAVHSSTFCLCGNPNGNVDQYRRLCRKDSALPAEKQDQVSKAVAEIHTYESTHVIDPTENLRNSRVYVYCGLQNINYRPDQLLSVVALYEHYLASSYLIYTRVQDTSAVLRVIDVNNPYSAICPKTSQADATVSPNCTSLSAPAEALGFILGGTYLNYINPFYPYFRYTHLEPLRSFNQTEFTVGLDNTGLDEIGYFYVPRYCQRYAQRYRHGYKSYEKPCLVHVYFHGCDRGREFLGTSHVLSSNYLQVAEQNYIIMLFPQALSSTENPRGCFDYVGFTGVLYATHNGPQIEAVWKMIERLLYLMPEQTTSTFHRSRRSDNSNEDHNPYQIEKNYKNDYYFNNRNYNMGCQSCESRPSY